MPLKLLQHSIQLVIQLSIRLIRTYLIFNGNPLQFAYTSLLFVELVPYYESLLFKVFLHLLYETLPLVLLTTLFLFVSRLPDHDVFREEILICEVSLR